MRRIVTSLVGLVIFFGAWKMLGVPSPVGAAPPTAADPTPVVIDGAEPAWVRELVQGARVEVFRSAMSAADPTSAPLSGLQPGPKLGERDLMHARDLMSPEGNANAVAQAQEAAEKSGTLADYTNFLLEMGATEKFKACLEMLSSGDYVVLPELTQLPKIPDEYLIMQLQSFSRKEPREKCDICFFIPKKDFPLLDQTWSAYLSALAATNDEECKQFNDMPHASRVAAIEAHEDAQQAISASADKRSKELDVVRKSLIPGKFIIDRRFALLMARPQRVQ